MDKAWKDVYDNEDFQRLSIDKRLAIRERYFENVVKPQVPIEDIGRVKERFDSYAESLKTAEDKSYGWLKTIVTNLKDNTIKGFKKAPSIFVQGGSKALEKTGISRATGVLMGTRMSPIAAYWGFWAAKHIDPKQFKELSLDEKALVSFGSGFHSAYRSITKKGDWGTLSGDYVKMATGKSIRENLPEGFKWMDVTLEVLMDLAPDVFIFQGIAKSILSRGIPTLSKEFIKAVPKAMADDVAKIVSNDKNLGVARHMLLHVMHKSGKARQGYIKFWDGITDKALQTAGYKRSSFSPELAKELGYKRIAVTPTDFIMKPTVAPSLSVRAAAIVDDPRSINILKAAGQGSEKELLDGIIRHNIGQKMTEFKGLSNAAEKNKHIPNAFRILTVAAEKNKALALENARKLLALGDKKINGPVKKALGDVYNPKARVTLQASGGGVAGIELDEDGNYKYNVGKGMTGIMLATGGRKLSGKKAKAFNDVLKKNPAMAKINNMMGVVPKSSRFVGLWGRVNTTLFNKFAALKDISPQTKREAEVFNSYLDASKLKFNILIDGNAKIKNDEALFTNYMLARRAVERAQRGIKNPEGVTYADATQSLVETKAILKEKGGQKAIDIFEEAAENWYAWSRKYILEDGQKGGILSKESVEGTIAKNQNYIAFDVLEHMPQDLHNLPVLKSKQLFSVSNQTVLKTMKGTEKQISNPFEATIRKFSEMQNVIARNKVASTLIDDPQAQKWLKPVATNEKEFKLMLELGDDPWMIDSWDVKKFSSLNRLKNGNLERYVVPKEIGDVMKKITPVQAPKVVAAFNSVFRASATTMYVPFTITNAFRDAFLAYTTSPVFKASRPDEFAISYVRGFWNGLKHELGGHSDLATLYLKEGGGFGYVGSLRQFKAARQDLFKKGLLKRGVESPVTNPFELIKRISSAVELGPRLGTFDRALIKAYKPHDSALLGRKATIDFNISGTFTQLANLYIPFLMANINAKSILAEALIKRPAQTIPKVIIAVMLPAAGSYAWNRVYHSKLYDDIPQNIKDNYFVTIIGEDKDKHGRRVPKYLTIPKGDVGQLAWNPMEFALDKMYKNDPEKLMPFLISYLSDISPIPLEKDGELSPSRMIGGLMPPVIKGGVETLTNHKFYWDQPVVSEAMQKLPPHLQYTELTPKSYKWLAKKFGGAPLHWQNMASNLFAGYGREGLDPSAMMRGLTGRLVKTRGGEIRSQVWQTIEDIDKGYYYVRAEAQELVKHGKHVPARKLLQQWNRELNPRLDKFDKRFKEHGYRDRGGLNESYRFTAEKMMNVLSPYKSKLSPLERKLIKGAK